MTKSNLLAHCNVACLLVLGAISLAGCDSNPTNEPTKDALQSADAKRAAAIDADPTMTPEGKKKMKEMLHLPTGDASSSAPNDAASRAKK